MCACMYDRRPLEQYFAKNWQLWEMDEVKRKMYERSCAVSNKSRDNCSCAQCRNVDTAQRQINVLKVAFYMQDAELR